MWTNPLFHKYHWCHVIDTVTQLYMIVGVGIKLKSMSVRSWRWTSFRLPLNPHIAARVLLKRANLSLVLMFVMTDAYGSLRFGGEQHFACLESLVLQRGCSSKRQIWALFQCSHYRCIWLPAFFSYLFSQSFVHSGTIPPLVVKTRGLNGYFSMPITVWLYLSLSFSCCW